jgi:hypothetical protein
MELKNEKYWAQKWNKTCIDVITKSKKNKKQIQISEGEMGKNIIHKTGCIW